MGNLQDKLNWKQCEEATFEEDDPKFAALLAEYDESGSEYKAPDVTCRWHVRLDVSGFGAVASSA
jgi:hypothetical protein